MKRRKPVEARLLGKWRSDKLKTIKYWALEKRIGAKKRKRFYGIFGKLRFRFTRQKLYSQYEDLKNVTPYSVVAKDQNSVVIMRHEKKGDSLQQIHFEDDSFYIVSGHNLEFFKKERHGRRITRNT
ncbi:MAG TPA: hypothetical protein VL754_06310 [Verrucomicrobiae bacterium]|nr:hypothetical protein [Verrucomicrobiae bacterium]